MRSARRPNRQECMYFTILCHRRMRLRRQRKHKSRLHRQRSKLHPHYPPRRIAYHTFPDTIGRQPQNLSLDLNLPFRPAPHPHHLDEIAGSMSRAIPIFPTLGASSPETAFRGTNLQQRAALPVVPPCYMRTTIPTHAIRATGNARAKGS